MSVITGSHLAASGPLAAVPMSLVLRRNRTSPRLLLACVYASSSARPQIAAGEATRWDAERHLAEAWIMHAVTVSRMTGMRRHAGREIEVNATHVMC